MAGREFSGPAYWEREQPREARIGARTLLRWYATAGKLQAVSVFKNDAGDERTRSTVTLDATALGGAPQAVALLQELLDAAALRSPSTVRRCPTSAETRFALDAQRPAGRPA